MALLEAHGVSVTYGGVRANDGVDLSVAGGTIVGLIGPNGAGKTTFVDAVTGFAPIAAGRVALDGVDLTSASPAQRAKAGMTRTFQSLELFEDLTVRDNLAVAAQRQRWYSLAIDLLWPTRGDRAVAAEIADIVELLEIAELVDERPADMSLGHRKLVGVARALATRPKLLLLDEPAAGLDTAESLELGTRLRAIAAEGVSILLIDHDMDLVMSVCDDVSVLSFGSVIAHGPPAAIQRDPAVVEAYLGAVPGEAGQGAPDA